jgi:hypothetical protein
MRRERGGAVGFDQVGKGKTGGYRQGLDLVGSSTSTSDLVSFRFCCSMKSFSLFPLFQIKELFAQFKIKMLLHTLCYDFYVCYFDLVGFFYGPCFPFLLMLNSTLQIGV